MSAYFNLTMDERNGIQSAEMLGYLGFDGAKVFTLYNPRRRLFRCG
jgi:hypothetical protein